MKKIALILLSSLLLAGCQTKENKITCSYDDSQDGVDYKVTTEIFYDEVMVTKRVSTETYTFKDETTLTQYQNMLDLMKSVFSSAKVAYDYQVDGLTVTTNSTVDYNTVDINMLVQIDPNEDKMMNDKKSHMDFDKMVKFYETSGRVCK